MKLYDDQALIAEFNEAAARLARQAADGYAKSTGRQVVLAGSIGPTIELFKLLGALTHSSAVAAFRE